MHEYEIVELKSGYGILHKGKLVLSSIETLRDAEYVCDQLNRQEREPMDIRRQLRRTAAKLEEEALLREATMRSASLIAARLIKKSPVDVESMKRQFNAKELSRCSGN